ncbi:unnamed protein product [Ambrosiozyma monospora]|uniref:Unnamed protein product n=1 Tax=Ambrosiozyma monospora TaxID=43982 RepID=A0A9W6YY29_AMBMO|nr:unnamed protein product [Ambrosiozyma monospora]
MRLLKRLNDYINQPTTPLKIFTQICVLQVFYYLFAITLIFTMSMLLGIDLTLKSVFDFKLITAENSLGLTLIILWLVDSLLCVFIIMIFIGRSKLAWDFAVTVHLINLLLNWVLNAEFPNNIYWWGLQLCSCALMVGLGTLTTRWKELRDTFFDGMVDPEESIPLNDRV